MNISLKVDNNKTSLKVLENLNFDFWRNEINKKGTYTPNDYFSK
jgi:hypothetical protein